MGDRRCMRCGAVGQDRRTLWHACGAVMTDLGIPFERAAVYGSFRHEPKAKAWGLSRTSFDSLTQEDGMYGGMTLSGTAQPVVDNRNHLPLDKDPVPAVLAASRRLTRGYVCCCRPRITPRPRTVAGKASAFDGSYLYYTAPA